MHLAENLAFAVSSAFDTVWEMSEKYHSEATLMLSRFINMVYFCNMFTMVRREKYKEWIRLRKGVAAAL